MITRGRDSDWADVHGGVVSSHRSTTSSRKPGTTFTGNVRHQVGDLAPCVKCGSMRRLLSGGPHAPRIANRGGRFVVVDCAGDEVTR